MRTMLFNLNISAPREIAHVFGTPTAAANLAANVFRYRHRIFDSLRAS